MGRPGSFAALTEAFNFVFYSIDAKDRLKFANSSWQELVRQGTAAELAVMAPLVEGRPLFEETGRDDTDFFYLVCESLRQGDCSYWEEIVPLHANGRCRWTLMRIQPCGDDLVFNCYFLRVTGPVVPSSARVRCLFTGRERLLGWRKSDRPWDASTSPALCPECSVHVYTRLLDEAGPR